MKLPILLCCLLLASQSFACDCDGTRTVKESFKSASIIITGTVIKSEVISLAETIQINKLKEIEEGLKSAPDELKMLSRSVSSIEIVVKGTLKGNVPDTVTIYTPFSGSECGYDFQVGQEYIIYAYNTGFYSFFLHGEVERGNITKENAYWTNMCTRTTVYYKEEVDELRCLR
jgi:hypothetical protein